jgi:lipid-A-disaccharide synthase
MRELKVQNPEHELKFYGLGGDKMITEGLNPLHHVKDLAAVGYIDVVKKYGFYKKVIREASKFIKDNNPDAVILIDYPGFNIRLAEKIRSFYNKKIIYYISPQLWAWHEKRVNKIKKFVDKMLVVFPFEVDFYKKFAVDAQYVGHPLVKRVKEFLDKNKKLNRPFGSEKVITILPGSRAGEIKHHMPVLIKVLEQLKKEFDIKVNIIKTPSLSSNVFESFKNEIKGYNLTSDDVYSLILNSDIVLTKAGTSTMECSLLDTPYLIFYDTSPLNYYLFKPVVKVQNLGIANILTGENIVREFVQKDFTAENLLLETRRILTDSNYAQRMKEKLNMLWELLGDKDSAHNAAKIIKETALA